MKTSCMLITAAMLGSSSLVYADNDLVNIFQEGLQDESPIPPENEPLPEGAEGIQNTWDCVADDPHPDQVENKYGLPSNILIDNSTPLYNYSFCRIFPMRMDDENVDGNRHMAQFDVKAGFVCGNNPVVTSVAPFKRDYLPDQHDKGGGAAAVDVIGLNGPSWELIQHGSETWNRSWTIHIDTASCEGDHIWAMKWIEIDLLGKEGGGPKGVFDVCLGPEVTEGDPDDENNGSGVGWPVQPNKPYKKLVTTGYTATYSKPVLPKNSNVAGKPGDPFPNPHDLYGMVRIDFDDPITGSEQGIEMPEHEVALQNLAFGFWTDTDCLPIEEIAVSDPDENNEVEVTIVGEGNVFFEQYSQSNPAQVKPLGHVSVERTNPEQKFSYTVSPGSCYKATAVDDSGTETGLTETKCY